MDSVKPAVCGVFCDDALKYTNTPFPDSENKSDENLAVAVLLFSSLKNVCQRAFNHCMFYFFIGSKPERRNMYSILKSIIMSQKEPSDALYHKIDVAWANGEITKEEAEALLKAE